MGFQHDEEPDESPEDAQRSALEKTIEDLRRLGVIEDPERGDDKCDDTHTAGQLPEFYAKNEIPPEQEQPLAGAIVYEENRTAPPPKRVETFLFGTMKRDEPFNDETNPFGEETDPFERYSAG